MYRSKLMLIASLLIMASLVLSACQPQTIEVVKTVIVMEEVEGQIVERVVTATPLHATLVPPTPKQAELKPSDTIVLALQQEPDTLHPRIGSMMARTIVLGAVILGCMAQDENADWVALGCEQVPTLENGGALFVGEGADKHLEVTLTIRDGWRWTDGTPVTSKDVIYNWKLVMDPEMEVAARNTTQKIYDIVANGDNSWTVQYMSENQSRMAAAGELEGNIPFAEFQEDYIQSGFGEQVGPVVDPLYWSIGIDWLPAHILTGIPAKEQASSDFAKKPLGDGPYVVKEWKQGQEIVLEKSDLPFPLGEPAIKTIIFRFFGETASVIAALQKGEIDVVTGTGGLTVANAPDLDKIEVEGLYRMLYEPGYQWEHIDLNTQKFPFDDALVRKALYHATDKELLVERLYYGRQGTTDLPVPPFSWAYTDSYAKYAFDPARAKELLSEAGWDCSTTPCTKVVDGVKRNLEFTLMTTDRADRQAVAQVLQQMWKSVGFGVNLQFLYGRGLFASCSAGGPLYCRTYDAAVYTWITGDDPGHLGTYDCNSIPTAENGWSGQNYPGWCDAQADIHLQRNETDPEISLSVEKRSTELEAFYKIWTDQVPVIPLFSNTRVYVARKGLENFRPGPTQLSPDTWNIWEWKLSK
jgi:peptide/nickel transport system substrate-binding protein